MSCGVGTSFAASLSVRSAELTGWGSRMDTGISIASNVLGRITHLEKKPTLVVSLGPRSIQTACRIAELTGVPCGVYVDAPVIDASTGTIVGTVSGTDDSSFWNSKLIHDIGLPQNELQNYAQLARVEGIREFHSLSLRGFKALPGELDREVVLCVSSAPLSTYTRYQLALLRQRRPDRIILLAQDEAASTLVESGLVEEVILDSLLQTS